MDKKYPQKTDSLNLEEISRRFFINSLPDDWICEKPSNDFGIDLRVDIFKNNQATGLELLVQLKSSQNSSNKDYETVSLKVSTYNYLRDKLQVAILVKYIKVENEAYWVLLKDIPEPSQDNVTFTVHIPKDNKLSLINWDFIYSHIKEVTNEKLAARRIYQQIKRKKSIKIAQEIAASKNYNSRKELYFSSSEGVDKAENEVEILFKEINNLVEEITTTSEVSIKSERKDDSLRKTLDLFSNNKFLSVVWHNDYTNTLKSSSLKFWLTKRFRWFDDYGEKGEVVLKKTYYSNIDPNDKIGWSESKEDNRIISSDELADFWMSKFLRLIE